MKQKISQRLLMKNFYFLDSQSRWFVGLDVAARATLQEQYENERAGAFEIWATFVSTLPRGFACAEGTAGTSDGIKMKLRAFLSLLIHAKKFH